MFAEMHNQYSVNGVGVPDYRFILSYINDYG
jgi:hypothetical protein